jgi:hypothetical protein
MTEIKLTIKAQSPIVHGSFGSNAGNTVLFRRMALVNIDGMPTVPVVSGNAIRGIARRLVMRELFNLHDLNRETIQPDTAWDKLYAALANGGHLSGSERSVNPTQMRQLREELPPLSVFGAALYTYILPGHASVGMAWLQCKETKEAGLVSSGNNHAEDCIEENGFVRHIERDQHDPELSGVTPMPVTVECLKTGSVLESHITFADHSTPEERGAVAYGLSQISVIGGKGSQGLGQVDCAVSGATAKADIKAYNAWKTGESVKQSLVSLALAVGKPSKKKGR